MVPGVPVPRSPSRDLSISERPDGYSHWTEAAENSSRWSGILFAAFVSVNSKCNVHLDRPDGVHGRFVGGKAGHMYVCT